MNFKKHPMQDERRIGLYRWVVWGILVAIYLIVFFHRLSVGVIAGDLNKSFGISATQIANLGAMYFYAYIVMQIPAGILVDYLGPKKTVVIGCVVAAFSSIMFSLSVNITMAYLSRLFVGLGVSVVFLCILKIQSNWFPAEKFATMSGLTGFIGSMGGLLAQTPLIVLVDLIGWRNSFLVMGITTFILAVLVIIFVKNTPIEMGFPVVNPQETQTISQRESIASQLLGVVKNPRVWCPAFVFGGVNGGFLLFTGTFGVSYIISVYGLSKTYAANLVSVVLLASGIASLLIGSVSDKLRMRKLPMIVLATTTVVAWSIIVFLKPSVILMSILVLLIGVTSSIAVLCWSVGKEVSNPKLAGMSMSIVNVFGFIFAAILMVICGKIIDINTTNGINLAEAYPKAFIVTVVSSIIALVFALLTTETRGKNIYNKLKRGT
jgi:sugar phosphate permease